VETKGRFRAKILKKTLENAPKLSLKEVQ